MIARRNDARTFESISCHLPCDTKAYPKQQKAKKLLQIPDAEIISTIRGISRHSDKEKTLSLSGFYEY
jgi:hypothetical protein